MTLKCMQALVRVQSRVRDQRARLSHEGSRRSMFAETNSLWESRYLQEIRHRKSMVSECLHHFKGISMPFFCIFMAGYYSRGIEAA